MPIPKSDAGEMPFLDHLEELRWRIIYSLGSLLVAMAIGFFVALKWDVVTLLAAPVLPLIPEHKLVYTHPSEAFSIIINVATTIGLVLSGPLILYQVWLFLSPALHKHEKRVAMGVLFSGVVLFVAGAALAYFVVIPLALPWLMGFSGPSLVPLITAEEYFSFAFAMVMTFGVSFELPIVVLALSALGIVTPQFLSKYRRHAIVLMVIVGAFLTPGDMVWTTVWMSVPLYGLYEMSVAAAYVMQRRKMRKRAAMEAEEAGLLT
jgi:sec-independent protein translocase protein TatC